MSAKKNLGSINYGNFPEVRYKGFSFWAPKIPHFDTNLSIWHVISSFLLFDKNFYLSELYNFFLGQVWNGRKFDKCHNWRPWLSTHRCAGEKYKIGMIFSGNYMRAIKNFLFFSLLFCVVVCCRSDECRSDVSL